MKWEVTHCQTNTRLLLILVSGRCGVGREAVSHLEFPVWVLGRLLGIPILIRNLLFQLRSLPDKLEPHTRCVINSSVWFCSFEAPSSNRLLTCSAETTVKFLVRKPICPRLFVFVVVTLSNILCTRKQMINDVVGEGGLFLFFVFRQLRQEQLYPVRIKIPKGVQHWAFKRDRTVKMLWYLPQVLTQLLELVAVGQPRSEVGVCAWESLHLFFPGWICLVAFEVS